MIGLTFKLFKLGVKLVVLGAIALTVIWATNRPPESGSSESIGTPTVLAATGPISSIKSITPTPSSFSGEGFVQAFKSAEQCVRFVSIQDPVDWWKLDGKSKGASKAAGDSQWQNVLLKQHKLGVFLQMDAYRPHFFASSAKVGKLRGKNFTDPEIRAAYIADAVQRVELYQPAYLGLAMEINSYYDKFPRDFDNYVSLFKEAYRAVKAVKPDMVVFVSFQYEELLGTFKKGTRDAHPPRWELIRKFEPEADAVGISTYPMKTFSPPRYGEPNELPADYYKQIVKHTNKPIIFAEMGWPSDPKFGGSPQKQAAFIQRLPDLLDGMDVRLVNWMFLYDIEGFGPIFDSMGFFDKNGTAKPGLHAWQSIWN